MTNQPAPDQLYPAGATDKWVSDVSDIAVKEINKVISSGSFYDSFRRSEIKFSDKDQAMINSRGFLKRSVRGFVTEFLHQTRDNTVIYSDVDTPKAREDNQPGLFQATATLDWMVKNDMNKQDALSALKVIIEHSARTFYMMYRTIDAKVPRAQVKRATKEIIDRVEQAEALRAERSKGKPLEI